VKAVLSGDTCVLLSQNEPPTSLSQLPPEAVFSLANCIAPRQGKTPGSDEPGAFTSRNWLREKLAGKVVKFECLSSSAGRYFGVLSLPGDENVNCAAVAGGYCQVKNLEKLRSVKLELVSDYEKSLLEAAGSTSKVGEAKPPPPVPNGMDLVRDLKLAPGDTSLQELSRISFAGEMQVLVEHVFDPSRFKCLVVGPSSSPALWTTFTAVLAGVAPLKKSADGSPHPLSIGGKNWMDRRILNRVLTAKVGLEETRDGEESRNALTVLSHPQKGDIAKVVLSLGFGTIAEWSLRLLQQPLGADGSNWGRELRTAEGNAKKSGVGCHARSAKSEIGGPVASTSTGGLAFTGEVIEIVTGDTIVVLVNGQAERRITLASIRGQRISYNQPQQNETFGYECKEALRKLVIGKTVTVKIDYTKDFGGENSNSNGNSHSNLPSKREYATVSYKKNPKTQAIDLGEYLVGLGYASLLIPQGDNKSGRYQALCDKEAEAQKSKVGMHSIRGSKVYVPSDSRLVSLEEQSKAKSYASVIQRAARRFKRLKGVVENVFGPTRLKVRLSVPGEKGKGNGEVFMIILNIVGIRTPMKGERFAEEGRNFARRFMLQREVSLDFGVMPEVVNIKGVFQAGLYAKEKNFAAEILQNGYGTVDEYFRDRNDVEDVSEYCRELWAGEANGKSSNVNIWANYVDPRAAKEEETVVEDVVVSDEKIRVKVCEMKGGCFYAQTVTSDNFCQDVANVTNGMKACNGGVGANASDNWARKNAMVCVNGGRGKIVERIESGQTNATIFMVDEGKTVSEPIKKLKPLAIDLTSVKQYPYAAKKYCLQGVTIRSSEEADAHACLRESIESGSFCEVSASGWSERCGRASEASEASVAGERAKRRASEASEHVIAKEIASERSERRYCEGNFLFGIYCGRASTSLRRKSRASHCEGNFSFGIYCGHVTMKTNQPNAQFE